MLRRRILYNTTSPYATAAVNDILCSDMSIISNSNYASSGKTAIGVVFYNENGVLKAMALVDIASKAYGTNVDLSLVNKTSESTAITDYDGKENTNVMVSAYGSDNTYAAGACRLFSTPGTVAGDWNLASAGEITQIYTNMTALNASLSAVSGSAFSSVTRYITSTEMSASYCWHLPVWSGALAYMGKNITGSARPIIKITY